MIFGYCTRTKSHQSFSQQESLIREKYPAARIITDEMDGRTPRSGFYDGFTDILSRAHAGDSIVVTDPGKLAVSSAQLERILYKLNSSDIKWIFINMPYLNYDFYAAHRISMNDAASQILLAYKWLNTAKKSDDSAKQASNRDARGNTGKPGRPYGLTGTSKRKYEEMRHALEHRGFETDKDLMKRLELSNNTFYKYKKLLKEESEQSNML